MGGIPNKPKSINNLSGIGIEFSYKVNKYFGINFGFVDYTNSSTSYNYFWHPNSFPPTVVNELYSMEINLYNIVVAPEIKYKVNKYLELNLSFGPNLSFGRISELLDRYYNYLHDIPSTNIRKVKDDAKDYGYQLSIGSDLKIYDRISFSIAALYTSNKQTFKGDFGLTEHYAEEKNKSSLEFDASGYDL